MLGRAKSDLIRIQSFIQTFEKFPSPARCFSWNKLKYPRKGKMIFLLKIPSHVCQPKNNTNKSLREGVLPPFQDKILEQISKPFEESSYTYFQRPWIST